MEHVNTKLRGNRKNSIKLQQNSKQSTLCQEEIIECQEEYVDIYSSLNNICNSITIDLDENDTIEDIEVDLNIIETDMEKLRNMLFDTKYIDGEMENELLSTDNSSDVFVNKEIKCILEDKYNPDIEIIGTENVVLIDVYKELEKELERQKQLKLNRGLYIF